MKKNDNLSWYMIVIAAFLFIVPMIAVFWAVK